MGSCEGFKIGDRVILVLQYDDRGVLGRYSVYRSLGWRGRVGFQVFDEFKGV